VIAQRVPDPHPGQGYLAMRLGQFPHVIDPVDHWIVPDLGQASLQQVQGSPEHPSDRFYPRSVHGFARTRPCQCRHQPERKALAVEKIRQRPMIVTGRFKTDHDGVLETSQVTGEMLKILTLVRHAQSAPPRRGRRFDKNIVNVS
jgi:hypothetical protein